MTEYSDESFAEVVDTFRLEQPFFSPNLEEFPVGMRRAIVHYHLFRGLDTAFSDIYETESANTFTDQLGDGLVLLVPVTLAIVAPSLIGTTSL